MEAFRRLPLRVRAIVALLLASGATHAGLAWGSTGGWRVLFAVWAAMAAIIAVRIVDGKTWRRWAGLALAGSLVGYWVELIGGHPADQIGITVKALEVFALYLVLSSSPDQAASRRFRHAAATAGLVVISILNATAVWAGAFGPSSGDTNPLDHHSHGSITPGMVVNAGEWLSRRKPTSYGPRPQPSPIAIETFLSPPPMGTRLPTWPVPTSTPRTLFIKTTG
jgi:hypothetical protein